MSSLSRKSVLVAAAFSAAGGAFASAQTSPIYSSPAYVGGAGGAGGFQEISVPKTSTGSGPSDTPGSSVATGEALVRGYIYYPSSTAGGTPVADTNDPAVYVVTSGKPVQLQGVASVTPPSGATTPNSTVYSGVTPYAFNPTGTVVVGSSSPGGSGSPVAAEWNATTGAITAFGFQNSDTSAGYSTASGGSHFQTAEAINSSGVTAGIGYVYYNGSNVGNAPMVWTSAGSAPILLPNEGGNVNTNGYSGTVYGINTAGTVVGSLYNYNQSTENGITIANTGAPTSAIAWTVSGGTYTANVLPSGATYTTQQDFPADAAKVINDSGVVAGYTNTVNGPSAAVWTPSAAGYTLLKLNSVGTSSTATAGYLGGNGDVAAINSNGDVVGNATVYNAAGTSVGTRPLLWLAGSVTPIQLQADGVSTSGSSDYAGGFHGSGPTGASKDLVFGVNAADYSVGDDVKYDASGNMILNSVATLWNSTGVLTELNSLIGITTPADSGATASGQSGFTNLFQADGITDTGWISGYGYYWDATGQDTYTAGFLIYDAAAAVPEPTSLTMLALGGVGLLRRQRRVSQDESK